MTLGLEGAIAMAPMAELPPRSNSEFHVWPEWPEQTPLERCEERGTDRRGEGGAG